SVEDRMRRGVGERQRAARAEGLLALRVLRQVEAEVRQLLIIRVDDDVADVALLFFRREDDRDAAYLDDLGDAPYDRVEDLVKVEGARQGLGELEHHLRVLLLARELLRVRPQPQLAAHAPDELCWPQRRGDAVVGAAPERGVDGGLRRLRQEGEDGHLPWGRTVAQRP